MAGLAEIVLSVDELEAVRLADLEGLYQEDAAQSMGVSRQTFANILGTARSKIARCLVRGLALRVDVGGPVKVDGGKRSIACHRRKRCAFRTDFQEVEDEDMHSRRKG